MGRKLVHFVQTRGTPCCLVVHLLESIVAFEVAPLHKNRTMPDTRAVIAIALDADMGVGKGTYAAPSPTVVALRAVAAESHTRISIAAATVLSATFPLTCLSLKDSDRANKVEFRTAYVDIGAILCQMQRKHFWQWGCVFTPYMEDSK